MMRHWSMSRWGEREGEREKKGESERERNREREREERLKWLMGNMARSVGEISDHRHTYTHK